MLAMKRSKRNGSLGLLEKHAQYISACFKGPSADKDWKGLPG